MSDSLISEQVKQYYDNAYLPEHFTQEEERFLRPFFTNLDKPVFVIKNLPSEVKGAVASRYSRATASLRRLFLNEYLNPIIYPDMQKGWENLSADEQYESMQLREKFFAWLSFQEENGGVEEIVNIQRGRAFFEKWLAQYGDDSIAELGAELVCLEGISLVASKEIEDKRIGISPLEKSTRYVQFWEKKANGQYQYCIPYELQDEEKETYIQLMDKLFSTYNDLAQPYLDYIKQLYPKGEDETETSFNASRGARRFDDLRELLPFGTQTNVALLGNGRAFEDLITRLLATSLTELQWCGQCILEELQQVTPSFVKRSLTPRGEITRQYRKRLFGGKVSLATKYILPSQKVTRPTEWVMLIDQTPDADALVIASYLFSQSGDQSLASVLSQVKTFSPEKRAQILKEILSLRQSENETPDRARDRFHKVPRAFENASYLFEFWARGGEYRDLHRHRQATQERQLFTTHWGYDVEQDLETSEFYESVEKVFAKAEVVFEQLVKIDPFVAQYVVPFGYIQHWYMRLTAREIYWIVELRTGPQGHPHYRMICQQLGHVAKAADPALFQGLLIDEASYSLARRESEKKIEKKLESFS